MSRSSRSALERSRIPAAILVVVVSVAFAVLVDRDARRDGEDGTSTGQGDVRLPGDGKAPPAEESGADGNPARQAFLDHRSGVFMTVMGRVLRILSDDLEGSRHQRFIVDVGNGHTVLVSHNIDLAPRVPVRRGVPVVVRGEYEWNAQGGVIHWTHTDPDGRISGGWIELDGRRFR